MHVQGKGSPAADRQNEEFSVTPKACSLKWGSTAGIQAHLKVLFDASASDPSHTLNAGEVVTLGGATCTGAGGGGGGCCCTMGRGEGGRALGEGIADAWLGAGIEEGTVMGGTAVATPPFFLFFFRDFFASSSAACSHRQPGQRTGIASHQHACVSNRLFLRTPLVAGPISTDQSPLLLFFLLLPASIALCLLAQLLLLALEQLALHTITSLLLRCLLLQIHKYATNRTSDLS